MLTIVTGSSQNHFKTSCQFLNSLFYFHKDIKCYFYDLGLNEESSLYIKNNYNVIFRYFNYDLYPDYFNIGINAGEYAWKSTIIEEVAKENGGILIWMDAGTKIINHLEPLINIIKVQDIYSAISSDNVQKWTHQSTLSYFNISDLEFLNKECRNASVMGFNLDIDNVRKLIQTNAKCAHIKECIAPEGSSRLNHRQDQAVFTILYYLYMKNKNTIDYNVSYTIHNDID